MWMSLGAERSDEAMDASFETDSDTRSWRASRILRCASCECWLDAQGA